ncbi:MAG: AAA family ATPase, partial [Trueperaceae bacterium]|nr:AAA family ATPase [Trueperaceae bacterium]
MAQLKTLGELKLEEATFTRPMPLLLLTYLSLEGPQHRRHLAELFWQEGNRMKSLSMTLTRLRKGAGNVVEANDKIAWSTAKSDAKMVLESLDKSDWQKAIELYTGAFLEGVVLEDWSSELEDWVYTTREYLAERVQYALLYLAEEAAKRQDFDKTRNLSERAYTLPGLSGTDLAQLKRLYPLLCAGRSLLAPKVRKELDDFGLNTTLTTEEARATFKPASTLKRALPTRGTTFVGRDAELTELATLLSKPSVSLLTLLGPAGVGKTRLALQLAHEQSRLEAFKDGVYFAPLDALNHASQIALSMLTQFGLTQQGNTEPLEQLVTFIAKKHILLVLDNFEHLIQGSNILLGMLSQCPNLKLLITSRERLKLEEEHLYTLEGLAYPTVVSENTSLSEAVQLFRERAQQVKSDFDLEQNLTDVIGICRLVEGLPLGLELSASWVRLMTCHEIIAELEHGLELLATDAQNVPQRHRSLKAAFEQSWKLLSPKEQEVLRKLSVFVGGFRREAASEVAGATIPLLASLVDKSLLRVLQNGRYDRHPLLYQFTREKLKNQPSEETEAKTKYAYFYLELAEQAQPFLQGKEQRFWLHVLSEELNNFRAVFAWLEIADDGMKALKLATLLSTFWLQRGHFHEGREHFLTLLEKTNGNKSIRAKA